MNGKTIRLYLVNGSPTDILTAEIINWTGNIFVAPRSRFAEMNHTKRFWRLVKALSRS